jgi:hypothetical protein
VQSEASVTQELRVRADPAAVWSVIADPSMHERLDPRSRIDSTSGDWRCAGSEFILMTRGSRVRYLVVQAEPGLRWMARAEHNGKQLAVLRAELTTSGADALLRWTVTVSLGRVRRWLWKRSCERDMPRWLAAVEGETLARSA